MPIFFLFLLVAILMVPNVVKHALRGDWQIALAELAISGVFGGIGYYLMWRETRQRRPR